MDRDPKFGIGNVLPIATTIIVAMGGVALAANRDHVQSLFSQQTQSVPSDEVDPSQGCFEYVDNRYRASIPLGKTVVVKEVSKGSHISWAIWPDENKEVECRETYKKTTMFSVIHRSCIRDGKWQGRLQTIKRTDYSLDAIARGVDSEVKPIISYKPSTRCVKAPYSLGGPRLRDDPSA